jgi:hypothetical protein
MKFRELIRSNSWLSVEMIFLQLFPDEKKNISEYEEVFNNLRHLAPIDTDITIKIKVVIDDYDNLEHVDVSGYYNDPEKSANDFNNSLALEFLSWEKWLGMDIDRQSLLDFSELELICHCLFEMTFFSFDQQEIQDELKRILDQVEEIKNMSEDEKKVKYIPLNDFLKKLKK